MTSAHAAQLGSSTDGPIGCRFLPIPQSDSSSYLSRPLSHSIQLSSPASTLLPCLSTPGQLLARLKNTNHPHSVLNLAVICRSLRLLMTRAAPPFLSTNLAHLIRLVICPVLSPLRVTTLVFLVLRLATVPNLVPLPLITAVPMILRPDKMTILLS